MAVEDRLISLEYQLRLTEDRIRTDLRERDVAWLEHARRGMMLLSRMIVEATSSSRDRLREPLAELAGELLIPDLEARAINVEEYRVYTPEKFEEMKRKGVTRAYAVSVLCYLVTAYVMALLASYTNSTTLAQGLWLGFLSWLVAVPVVPAYFTSTRAPGRTALTPAR